MSAARADIWARLAGRPLIQPRELPSVRITRRSWQVSPSSSSSWRSQSGGFRKTGEIEFRGQFGAVAAGAHHAAVGAGTGQQHQRVDQQGLARAGLATDHGQARAKGDLGFFDDGELTDVERGEHGHRSGEGNRADCSGSGVAEAETCKRGLQTLLIARRTDPFPTQSGA